MNKFVSAVIAVALVVIAINMTHSNMSEPAAQKTSLEMPKEKVMQVIGRICSDFTGITGGAVGFLATDGTNFKVLPYDERSMAANEAFRPKYVTTAEFENGKIAWSPITVEPL